MAFQSLDHLERERTDLGLACVRPQGPGHAHVVLFAVERYAGKGVLHVLVGVLTQAAVEEDVPSSHIMQRVPQAFSPHGIAGVDVVKGAGDLMAKVVVASSEHASSPEKAISCWLLAVGQRGQKRLALVSSCFC